MEDRRFNRITASNATTIHKKNGCEQGHGAARRDENCRRDACHPFSRRRLRISGPPRRIGSFFDAMLPANTIRQICDTLRGAPWTPTTPAQPVFGTVYLRGVFVKRYRNGNLMFGRMVVAFGCRSLPKVGSLITASSSGYWCRLSEKSPPAVKGRTVSKLHPRTGWTRIRPVTRPPRGFGDRYPSKTARHPRFESDHGI